MDANRKKIFQTVAAEFVRLNVLLPIQTDHEFLSEKARIFAEELAAWNPETIRAAFREHAKKSRYMPTLAEILENCRQASQALEYKRQRERAALTMPEQLPEETRQQNLSRIQVLKKKLKIGSDNINRQAADHTRKVKAQAKAILNGRF
jgi:hypothetical protein